jgi:hypothetical protein
MTRPVNSHRSSSLKLYPVGGVTDSPRPLLDVMLTRASGPGGESSIFSVNGQPVQEVLYSIWE